MATGDMVYIGDPYYYGPDYRYGFYKYTPHIDWGNHTTESTYTVVGDQTKKCPCCGELYVVIACSVDDQTACPRCVKKARRNMSEWKNEKEHHESCKWWTWDHRYSWCEEFDCTCPETIDESKEE